METIEKGFKYRIYPTKEQQELLNKTFGCCRFVWNNILNWRSKEYSLNGIKTNYSASSKRLTQIKHDRDINAAINIKNIGLSTLGTSGIYACGDSVRHLMGMQLSVKQEARDF